MDIILEKTIRHGAYAHAISHDLRRMAISSDNDIAIYSIPDFCMQTVVPVRNASSMVFLSDNASMLILNSAGQAFFWNGSALETLGRWAVPEWYDDPLCYGDDSHIFWGSVGGVWRYDVERRSMKQILCTPKSAVICRCDHGVVKILLTDSPPADEQIIEIVELSYDGEIRYRKATKYPLKTRLINRPAWSTDDLIAISTIAAPQQSKSKFERMVTYKFTPEGRAVLEQDFWIPEYESPPHCMLYLLDKNGNILLTKESDLDDSDGDLYSGNGILAECCTGEECVVLMQLDNLQEICRIGKASLTNGSNVNPPTFVWFAPDNLLVIGSWNRLFVFRIVFI